MLHVVAGLNGLQLGGKVLRLSWGRHQARAAAAATAAMAPTPMMTAAAAAAGYGLQQLPGGGMVVCQAPGIMHPFMGMPQGALPDACHGVNLPFAASLQTTPISVWQQFTLACCMPAADVDCAPGAHIKALTKDVPVLVAGSRMLMPQMTQLRGLQMGGQIYGQAGQMYGSGGPSPQQVSPQQAAAQQSYGMLLMQQAAAAQQQQAQQQVRQQQIAAGGRRGGGGSGSFGSGMPPHTMGYGPAAGGGSGIGSPADIGSLGASLAAMQLGGGGAAYGSPMLPLMPGGGQQQQAYPGASGGFGGGGGGMMGALDPSSFSTGGGYYGGQQRQAGAGPRGQQWPEQEEGDQ